MKMPRNHKQLKSICAPECATVCGIVCMCMCVCFFQVRFELFPIRWLSKLSTCFSIVYAQILQQFFFSLSLNINQLLFQIYWAHKSQIVYTITYTPPPRSLPSLPLYFQGRFMLSSLKNKVRLTRPLSAIKCGEREVDKNTLQYLKYTIKYIYSIHYI